MLNVSYKNTFGYFTETLETSVGVFKNRIDICSANCVCAMVHAKEECPDPNFPNYKVRPLFAYFKDMAHAKRAIKGNIFRNCNNFVFNAKNCNTEMWKIIRLIAESGKKVTIK